MTHNISNSSFFDPHFNFKADSLFVCFYHFTAIGTMTNTGPFLVSLLVHSSCYYKIWKQPCANQSPALGCVPTSTWQALAKILICGWFWISTKLLVILAFNNKNMYLAAPTVVVMAHFLEKVWMHLHLYLICDWSIMKALHLSHE